MRSQIVSFSLVVCLYSFLSLFSLQAIPPIIETIEDPTAGRVLAIRGRAQLRDGALITIRTPVKNDITLQEKSPGLVSQARLHEADMQYGLPSLYEAGKCIQTHYETQISYDGIWEKRLKAHNFCTLYVLEDTSTPHCIFIGYVLFQQQSSTKLSFFAHVVDPYKRRGIIQQMGKYILEEFLPEIRAHRLTRDWALPYETLSFPIPPRNPLAATFTTHMEGFFRALSIPATRTSPYALEIKLGDLPPPKRPSPAALTSLPLSAAAAPAKSPKAPTLRVPPSRSAKRNLPPKEGVRKLTRSTSASDTHPPHSTVATKDATLLKSPPLRSLNPPSLVKTSRKIGRSISAQF